MITYREIFTQLLVDLRSLSQNDPVIVQYNEDLQCLVFRQVAKLIMLPYLNKFYFPKKGFKIGVLTQSALQDLTYNVSKLLSNNEIDNLVLVPDIGVLKTSFYKYYDNKELKGPQKILTLKYANITSIWATFIYCNTYNDETKLLWKSYVNSRKMANLSKPNKDEGGEG